VLTLNVLTNSRAFRVPRIENFLYLKKKEKNQFGYKNKHETKDVVLQTDFKEL
jgi:hypothetical protein